MESAFFENSPIDFRLQKFINGLALASYLSTHTARQIHITIGYKDNKQVLNILRYLSNFFEGLKKLFQQSEKNFSSL